MGFHGKDIICGISYPAVAHSIISETGIGWLISRALSECLHIVNAYCEEWAEAGWERFEGEEVGDRGWES